MLPMLNARPAGIKRCASHKMDYINSCPVCETAPRSAGAFSGHDFIVERARLRKESRRERRAGV